MPVMCPCLSCSHRLAGGDAFKIATAGEPVGYRLIDMVIIKLCLSR
jgi:hypothetical protein